MNLTIISQSFQAMLALREEIHKATHNVFKEIHIVQPNDRDPKNFVVKTYLGYEKYNGKFIVLMMPRISSKDIDDFIKSIPRCQEDNWATLLGTYDEDTIFTTSARKRLAEGEVAIYRRDKIVGAVQEKLAEMVAAGAFD